MKWKNIGHKMYESGEWQIEHQATWLNPRRGWYIRRNGVYLDEKRTLAEAKAWVVAHQPPPGFMELAGAGIERPVIKFVALREPDVRRKGSSA